MGILEQLRQTPALLDAVAACSEAERGSQKRLRIEFDGTLVRAAVALHEARQRASGRLPEAGRLWLTRIGVEQATAWPVARHKAERFAGCSRVADLCCGIGSDTAALSQLYEVLSVDRSPAMVRRAEWNTAVLGQLRHFCGEVADVTRRDWTGWFVHADPDRRVGRNRPTRRLADYQPGLP
ncbi:MAG: class I SAM-dependent methyltransferase, partial [Planctomycetia bacterium]|nr:class I SAM-dependent methyltransferase [Planctomycetia bacterium]